MHRRGVGFARQLARHAGRRAGAVRAARGGAPGGVRAMSEPLGVPPEPWRRAPCSSARAHNWPIAAVIPIIIALNYIPFVVWNLQRGCLLGLNIVLIVVWHFLLGMLVSAWVNTCITDPGVPPERWQRQMVQEQVRSPHSTPTPNAP